MNHAQFDDNTTIADRTIALMRERNIPINPDSFSIWFGYCAGSCTELKAMGDRLLAMGDPITEKTNTWLFNTFSEEITQRRALMDASYVVTKTMTDLAAQVDKTGSDAELYGHALGTYEAILVTGDRAAISDAVKALLAATHRMREENTKLEIELAKSSRQITELTGTLEDSRKDAVTDKLTGLANRRAFDHALAEALKRARAEHGPLTLLMLDVDHFKKFNDTFGHKIGDEVLRLVARTLIDNVKGRDTAARYGGEEFAIILPDTTIASACAVAEKVRGAMASRRIVRRNSGTDYGQVTLSVGVAMLRDADDADALVGRADEALYVAKRNGRNRVHVDGDVTASALAKALA